MSFGYWLAALARVISSVLCAGVFYVLWLAAFLKTVEMDSLFVKAVAWLLAPVVTAAGFAAGVAVLGFLTKNSKSKFLTTFKWTLIGCTVGAAAVVWFGPMLIVFGMFAAGTASVVLKEVLPVIKKTTSCRPTCRQSS